ncbi:MAG: NUDIX hydrolase [Planctomycetia bacterium]|nr:NUDIX hydrolase [Planctomycetia bacterium]
MVVDEPEILLETRRFRVVRRVERMPDGQTHARDVIEHPGAVGIVPVLDDGRICLVRNFRVAVDRWLVEIPAGTLEPGEDPVATAHRELAEETGYRAGRLAPLCQLLFSPGILHERMHLFVASNLSRGATHLDVGERVEPFIVDLDEAILMIERGEIEDAKTVAGLLYYDRWRRKSPAT